MPNQSETGGTPQIYGKLVGHRNHEGIMRASRDDQRNTALNTFAAALRHPRQNCSDGTASAFVTRKQEIRRSKELR